MTRGGPRLADNRVHGSTDHNNLNMLLRTPCIYRSYLNTYRVHHRVVGANTGKTTYCYYGTPTRKPPSPLLCRYAMEEGTRDKVDTVMFMRFAYKEKKK